MEGPRTELLPEWFIKHRRAAFSIFSNAAVCILAIVFASNGKKNAGEDGKDNWLAYLFAFFVAFVALPIEWAVDRRSPELTKDLRFDLAGAMIAMAIIRLEATRKRENVYFQGSSSLQVGLDVFFFLIFLGAKLVGRHGNRELAMLIMADVVDFIEMTFMIAQPTNNPAEGEEYTYIHNSTRNAIVCFSFIFTLVTLLLQRAEGPGQKALNALVQGVCVHLPIIAIRCAIPLSIDGMNSFNAVFIVKNIVELFSCGYDFLEAGSQVKAGTASYDAV